MIDLDIKNLYEDLSVPIEFIDADIRLDVGLFANKLTVQKYIIDILPNHERCIAEMV